VTACHPMPEKIRRPITNGTGRWIERNHCQENLLAWARQQPKGRFAASTMPETMPRVMPFHPLASLPSFPYETPLDLVTGFGPPFGGFTVRSLFAVALVLVKRGSALLRRMDVVMGAT
jgi:hypothetical protein